MSTKIYTGFKVTGLSLHEISCEISALGSSLKEKAQLLQVQPLLEELVEAHDLIAVGVRTDPPEALSGRLIRKFLKDETADGPLLDVALFPLASGDILGMFFGDNALLEDALNASWLQRYPYWNNTDRDPDLTEAEWEERRRLWDEALGETSVPSREGFCRKVLEREMVFDRDLMARILEKITLGVRAQTAAKHIVVQEVLAAENPEGETNLSGRSLFRIWRKLETDSALKERVFAKAVEVEQQLVSVLTLDHLMEPQRVDRENG